MKDFLKVFGRGIIYTLLFPLLVCLLAIFTVYCTIVFIITLFRNIVVFFMGGNVNETKLDKEAKKILEQREQTKSDMTEVLSDLMHTAIAENPEAVKAMAQQEIASQQISAQAQAIQQQRALEQAQQMQAQMAEMQKKMIELQKMAGVDQAKPIDDVPDMTFDDKD